MNNSAIGRQLSVQVLFNSSFISSTKENLNRRITELEETLERVLEANEQLKKKIDKKLVKSIHGESSIPKVKCASQQHLVTKKERNTSTAFSENQHSSSNKNQLVNILTKLSDEIDNVSNKYHFLKKKHYYEKLQASIIGRETEKEKCQSKLQYLQEKLEYLSSLKKRYHGTIDYEVTSKTARNPEIRGPVKDLFLQTTAENSHNPFLPLLREGIFDSDEPEHVAVINNMIIHINKFEDYFHNKQYYEAAIFVAQSPYGILVTHQILDRFKQADGEWQYDKHTSPLMILCKTLMKTSQMLTEKLSFEIIRSALKYKDLALAKFWMCQNQFKTSLLVGHSLRDSCKCDEYCTCGIYEMALNVYLKLSKPKLAALCLLHLRSFHSMMLLGKRYNFSASDYVNLFSDLPSLELLKVIMVRTAKTPVISFIKVVSIFLSCNKHSDCLSLLKYVNKNGYYGGNLLQCLMDENIQDLDEKMILENLVNVVERKGEKEQAEELLSCIVTKRSLEKAALFCLTDYFS